MPSLPRSLWQTINNLVEQKLEILFDQDRNRKLLYPGRQCLLLLQLPPDSAAAYVHELGGRIESLARQQRAIIGMQREHKRHARVGWRRRNGCDPTSEGDGKTLEGATEVAQTQLQFDVLNVLFVDVLLSYARRQVLVSGAPEHGGVQLRDDHVQRLLQDEYATKLEKSRAEN